MGRFDTAAAAAATATTAATAIVVVRVGLYLLLLLLSLATVNRVNGGTILSGKPVWLTEGDTLYLRWQTGLGPLDRCAALLPDGTEKILSDNVQSTISSTIVDHPCKYMGDGYQSGQCGLRANNVTPGVSNWTLRASTADGRHNRYTSRVTCIAKQWLKSNTVRVAIGNAANITCGPPMAFYCRMSSPSGKVSRHQGQCRVHIKSVGSQHISVWTCWSVTADSAAEVQYTTQLQTYREGALTETGFDETPSELRVFCNVHDGTTVNSPANNGTSTVRLHDDGGFRSIYCKLTLPEDAETLSLAYGRGTTRYAYHGSTDNDCGVSFPKPPRRSEVGLWKCMNTMSDGRFYGGFVFVASPNDTKKIIPPFVVTTGQPLVVSKGNSFQLECSVPSEIDYCWLRHPNGTAIPVSVPDSTFTTNLKKRSRYGYTGEGLSFGQCHVTIDNSSPADTGTWQCALGLRNDRREMYGTVDVTVFESVIAAFQYELYASEGSRVTLGCYTLEKQPIAYCRFLTPHLFGFAVDENSSSPLPSRYAYSGQGLAAGHCSLSVTEVDDSDYGNWTCAVRILDSTGSEEVSTIFELKKPEGFTMVQIIGIVLCGTLISIMSLFFANHLISSPSAKTRKKIEKLEQLEAAEIGGSHRFSTRHAQNNTRIIKTQPICSKLRGSIPLKV